MPTLCPIALTAGCAKCPIFKVCPLKGVIGDQRAAPPAESAKAAAGAQRSGRPAGTGPGAGKSKSKPKRGGGRRGRR